jgi:hypothetical protein
LSRLQQGPLEEADVKPGKGAIADCMKEDTDELSDSCKNAMAKAEAGNK